MKICLQIAYVAFALLTSQVATAAAVVANKANCRAEASERAPLVGTLERGTEVGVVSSSGGWSEVDPPTLRMCWIRSDLLAASESVKAMRARRASAAARARTVPPIRRSFASGRSSSQTRNASNGRRNAGRSRLQGGSCPCSGSNVCVGPRGGRYCITSGGNKRYGV